MSAPAASVLATSHREEAPDLEGVAALGMWIFLASEVLLFGGLFFAYLYGRWHWPSGFATASHETDVVAGTLNTAVMLTSSALVALAVACQADAQRRRRVAPLLAAAAALGVFFLAVKGYEYRTEWLENLFPGPSFAQAAHQGAELFFTLYFVMTGLHGLHLIVGIAILSTLSWGSARGRSWFAARRLEAGGLYWHFVDVIWIFLYPLLYLVTGSS